MLAGGRQKTIPPGKDFNLGGIERFGSVTAHVTLENLKLPLGPLVARGLRQEEAEGAFDLLAGKVAVALALHRDDRQSA